MNEREGLDLQKDLRQTEVPEAEGKKEESFSWKTELMNEMFRGVQDSVQQLEAQSQKAIQEAQREADNIRRDAKQNVERMQEDSRRKIEDAEEEACRSAEQLKKNAREEAEKILEQAKTESGRLQEQARQESSEIRRKAQQISREAEKIREEAQQSAREILEEGKKELDSLHLIILKQLEEIEDIQKRYEEMVQRLSKTAQREQDLQEEEEAETVQEQVGVSEAVSEEASPEKPKKKRKFRKIFSVLMLAVVTLGILFQTVWGISVVKESAMSPSLKRGYLVLYSRLDKEMTSGDILILKQGNSSSCFRRVIGTEGDIIDMDEQTGRVLVNQNVVMDEVDKNLYTVQREINFPLTVQRDTYFVLKDNREEKGTSEEGLVKKEQVKGKVIQVLKV